MRTISPPARQPMGGRGGRVSPAKGRAGPVPGAARGSLVFDLHLLRWSAGLCWPCLSFCLLKIPFED